MIVNVCLVLIQVATVATQAPLTLPHPNILFFLVDDGGFESPVWGNPVISTPHISALAHSGTRSHPNTRGSWATSRGFSDQQNPGCVRSQVADQETALELPQVLA